MTTDAQRILTVRDGAVLASMECTKLGHVTGDGSPWGGMVGTDIAYNDAKNKAGEFPNADTMLVTSSVVNPFSKVYATVYDCSNKLPRSKQRGIGKHLEQR